MSAAAWRWSLVKNCIGRLRLVGMATCLRGIVLMVPATSAKPTDAWGQGMNSVKQAMIGACVGGWGYYSLLEAATSWLSLLSVILACCVGVLAIRNGIKASRKLDAELAEVRRSKDG